MLSTRAKDQKKSRIDSIGDSQDAQRFPDVEPFEYIIEILSTIGVALNSGNGVHSLTWQEINAFVVRTGLYLNLWESVTIKGLSAIYANSVLKYDNQDVMAPFKASDQQERIAVGMKSVLKKISIKDKHGLSNYSNKNRQQAGSSSQ